MQHFHAYLAMHKPTDAEIRQIGPSVNALVDYIVNNDPDFPVNASESELKNYTRRVRRHAYKTILEETHKRSSEMTTQEHAQRQLGLESSEFAAAILRDALASGTVPPTEAEIGADSAIFNEEFPEPAVGNVRNLVEADAEDVHLGSDETTATARFNTEDEEDDSGVTSSVPFRDHVFSMMSILLDNRMSENAVPFAAHGTTCQACIDDPTTSDDRKVRFLFPLLNGSATYDSVTDQGVSE